MECEARRCFPHANIEALAASSGQLFVISEWWRKHHPDAPTVLEQKRDAIKQRIESAEQMIQRAKDDLAALTGKYRSVRP